MKISLYKFITTFCLVPVNDWTAFVQRLSEKILKIWLVMRLVELVKGPFFWISFSVLLMVSPDFFAWIFIKIGEIELTVMSIVLSAVMPDLFSSASGEYGSWVQLWQQGLSALPTDMVEVMNSLGVAQLLGYVTATFGAVFTIKVFRSSLKRARLM